MDNKLTGITIFLSVTSWIAVVCGIVGIIFFFIGMPTVTVICAWIIAADMLLQTILGSLKPWMHIASVVIGGIIGLLTGGDWTQMFYIICVALCIWTTIRFLWNLFNLIFMQR